jgi:hypothetical protein
MWELVFMVAILSRNNLIFVSFYPNILENVYVNAELGKWIWGYGYPINKKHPRPFTLTAYRLAGVRCCRSLVLMVSAAVALWVAVGLHCKAYTARSLSFFCFFFFFAQ